MNCTWKREFLFNDYATSCGKSYWFGVDVTPKEKGFEYCPFCGYPLVTGGLPAGRHGKPDDDNTATGGN